MRLIDADTLLKSCRIVPVHDGENWAYTPIVTDSDVLTSPTINPEDLRAKGRWESQEYEWSEAWACSNCGDEWFFETDPIEPTTKVNYCPNCGAKMDLEVG